MIYLDYNATAPVRPEVREVMSPILFGDPESGLFGNASSVHWAGQRARKHLEAARTQVAELLGRKPSEILFTSGGSESNNMALFGLKPKRLLLSAVEHPSVRAPAEALRQAGTEVVELPVDGQGQVQLASATLQGASLLSVMAVNNETGVISPLEPLLEQAQAQGVPVHVDAVQAAGRIPLPLEAQMLTLSGHKIGAPKGVGLLATSSALPLAPLILGGPQERGRRAGTEQVAGAVGFAEALRLALEPQADEQARLAQLMAPLEALLGTLPGVSIVGAEAARVRNTVTAVFEGVEGEALLQALDLASIAASSGSACSSGSLEPSHVLLAMGYDKAAALSAVRFSVGWASQKGDVDRALQVLPKVLQSVRSII